MINDQHEVQSLRVLLRTATARDGVMASDILRRNSIICDVCKDTGELISELSRGAGALLLAEEALTEPSAAALMSALAAQPPWSDLSVLVLARQGASSRAVEGAMELPANVSVLERPVRVATLISVVRSALRARKRQYELADLLDGLREADQRKTEFLATLAHELRNPMAPLSTALSILTRMKPEPEKATHYYELMDRQVKHMVRLVDDLMEISRVTRAQIDLHLQPLVIDDVLREAVELSKPLLDAPGHELQLHVTDPGLQVTGDRVRLVQVFSNLLNNAAKYTPERGQIELWVRQAGDAVEICVQDNGQGIPPDMLDSIFGMFVQVNGTARAAQGGLGIGLTLVRTLVGLHHGSVEARSAGTGRGTQVTVRLPMRPAAADPGPSCDLSAKTTRLDQRILVVDDNRDAADSLAAALAMMGADTCVAYDGGDALEKAAAQQPSIAILDIGMPQMDGYELARRLREDPRHSRLALVALTGWGQAEDRKRVSSAGFHRHLLKPVDLADLTLTLQQLSRRQGFA